MRRSQSITLVLLGVTALAACGPVGTGQVQAGDVAVRDTYSSRSDCESDWDRSQCETRTGGGFYGPYLFGRSAGVFEPSAHSRGLTTHNLTAETAAGIRSGAVPSAAVTRSGFGSTGARASASS